MPTETAIPNLIDHRAEPIAPLHADGCPSCGREPRFSLSATGVRETIVCTNCNRECCYSGECVRTSPRDSNGNSSGYVCTSCSSQSVVCGVCSERTWFSTTYTPAGRSLTNCVRCYRRLFPTCVGCNLTIFEERISFRGSDGSCVCTECSNTGFYSRCSHCEEVLLVAGLQLCACGSEMCSRCLENHRRRCSATPTDLIEYAKDLVRSGSSAILGYHPGVRWSYKRSKKDIPGEILFGVELEVECGDYACERDGELEDGDDCECEYCLGGNASARLADVDKVARLVGKELAGSCICSHDSSIKNGFEIVFTPHTRTTFKEIGISKVLQKLSAAGASSHKKGTCGLHVHLERNSWFRASHSANGKTYNNADMYQRFFYVLQKDIIKFSQRSQETLNHYCRPRISRDSRHIAVNLTNSKTVEVRIWRGTLSPARFRASLLFTLAVVDFIKEHKPSLIHNGMKGDELTVRNVFKDWLSSASQYQFIKKYFVGRSLFGFGDSPIELSNRAKVTKAQAELALQDSDFEEVIDRNARIGGHWWERRHRSLSRWEGVSAPVMTPIVNQDTSAAYIRYTGTFSTSHQEQISIDDPSPLLIRRSYDEDTTF